MKLPLHLYHNTSVESVEEKIKARIRSDKQIARNVEEISIILFTHSVQGVVGMMYGGQYTPKSADYEVVLNLMGFKWDHLVKCPTAHYKLKAVS